MMLHHLSIYFIPFTPGRVHKMCIRDRSFSIAVDRRFSGKNGERQADFINCVAWRQTAEFIAKYFPKGRMIAVCGSLQTRTWDDQDGKKRYAMDVVVDEAYFTGSAQNNGSSGAGAGSYPSAQQAPSRPSYNAPQQPSAPIQDFSDIDGFAPYDDGSEDDLPF